MSYTTIDDPTIYFNTKPYAGNNSTQSITGVGFQPDWVWLKSRSDAGEHTLYDSVRGATKRLDSAATDSEDTVTNGLTSFDSDGFSLGAGGNENSASSIVSWNWKASGSTASNTDGTNITSTVSANTTAGFSIVSYTGSGTISDTVGHGLGTTPNVVIIKNRDTGTSGWNVHHSSLSSGYNLQLQATSAQFNSTGQGHIGTVGSSTFGFVAGSSGNDQVNDSSEKYIAYCFAEKKGFSKFGSYTGNGNTDGTFVYTGFKPAWFIVKKSSASGDSWVIIDSKRFPHNFVDKFIYADESDAESGSAERLDFLSNGIKIRATHSFINTSGATYIYMAFAENPFVSSTGIPTTAR
jgi:hypothetical protein